MAERENKYTEQIETQPATPQPAVPKMVSVPK